MSDKIFMSSLVSGVAGALSVWVLAGANTFFLVLDIIAGAVVGAVIGFIFKDGDKK